MRTHHRSFVLIMAVALHAATLLAQTPGGKNPVVVLKGSSEYHDPACPAVKGAVSPTVMTQGKAELQKLKPHDCKAAMAAATRTSTGAQLVWVDLSTKRYHLAGCSLVGLPRAQMSLQQAAAKYKPCNKCKPPGA